MPLNEPEEIDVLGKWWVPGRDQPHHPGVLRCNNEERPCLNLFDNLGFLTKPVDGVYTDRSFFEFFPIVCGRTELGPATLINFPAKPSRFPNIWCTVRVRERSTLPANPAAVPAFFRVDKTNYR